MTNILDIHTMQDNVFFKFVCLYNLTVVKPKHKDIFKLFLMTNNLRITNKLG